MENPRDETRMIRDTLRDVVALSALPAMWVDYEPQRVAANLADVLLHMLGLDFVYLRLPGQGGRRGVEVARTVQHPTVDGQVVEIRRTLSPFLERGVPRGVESMPNPIGSGTVQVVLIPVGFDGEGGLLVAGSQQSGFPGEEARPLLGVGANQAAMMLQRLRAEEALRESEGRLAADLTAMARLQEVSTRLVRAGDSTSLLLEIVDAAIAITTADMGNIQLLDLASGALKIEASRGFDSPFLDFFNAVHDGQAACGTAMRKAPES
jgi:PAS domain-containing protein